MATVDARSWSQSNHPWRQPESTSARSSSPSLSPRQPAHPLLDRIQSDPETINGPAPWYRAVTADRPDALPTTSHLEQDEVDLTIPRESTDDVQTSTFSDSPTAVSRSQRSASPAPARNDHEMSPPEVDATSLANQLPGSFPSEQTNSKPVSSPWSRKTYPMQHITEPSTENQVAASNQSENLPHSVPVSEQELESDRPAHPIRTLRRTPRSRRINPSTSPRPVREASPSVMSTDDDQSVDTLVSHPWKRQVYPGQANPRPSATQHPPTPPSEREPEVAESADSDHPEASEQSSPPSSLWDRRAYPLQPTADGQTGLLTSTSTPVSEPEMERAEEMPANPHNKDSSRKSLPTEKASSPWHRKVYPLQSPASRADLRRSPTPPPSPGRETASMADSAQESDQGVEKNIDQAPKSEAASRTKAFHRKAYPLQSPASISNLRHPPSPSPSPERAQQPDNVTVKPQQSPQDNNRQALAKRGALRRQVYPLQSPASVANLKQSQPTEKRSGQNETDEASDSAGEKSQSATRSNVFRRRAYPLQSPASIATLKQPQSTQQEPDEPRASEAAGQIEEHEEAVPRSNNFRRKGYPLQISATHSNRNHQPLPPPASAPTDASKSKPNTQVGKTPNEVSEERSLKNTPEDHAKDHDEPSTVKNVLQRLKNPLQILPTTLNSEHTVSSPQAMSDDSPDQEESTRKKARNTELAAKVINQWRRTSYPLQSPEHPYSFDPPPPEWPQVEEKKKEQTPQKIHLPRNIPAVKDAKANDLSRGKTIVVCLDGTGDKFDNDNSNIVHLISALKKDDPHQVTYYQAGIGTYGDGGLSGGASAALDMAVGSGLGLHVRDAYRFLMHAYKEGDRICIFGFSRGAYTARCVAGMIHKVGLLPPRNLQQIPFAYEFYANDTEEGWKQSEDFKRTFCIDVNVHFIGCFDSVASVGFIPRQLPLSSTPSSKPRYFRHAMAIDERRAKFKVCRHQTKTLDEIKAATSFKEAIERKRRSTAHKHLPNYKNQDDQPPEYSQHAKNGKHHPNMTNEEWADLTKQEGMFDTDVLEVWFAGAHADVGGGAVANDERHKLAQIPLRWMIRQAFECNTGILFKTKVLAEFGLDVHTLWPKYERLSVPAHGPPPSYLEKFDKSLPPRYIRRDKLVAIDKHEKGEQLLHLQSHHDEDWTPEQVEDFYDAMSIINDQLVQAPSWWILEFWPVQYKIPVAPGEVSVRTGMNMGWYRAAEEVEPKVHWTVQHRIQQMGYKIGVRTAANTTWKTVV